MALFDLDLETKTEKSTTTVTDKPAVKRTVSYNELVHMNRVIKDITGYDDFTEEKYPHGFVFYDFEVFMYDWLVVLIDPINKTKTIIVNNRNALKEYFDQHCNAIWTGYNNLHYDVAILKGIISGLDAKEISDDIIIRNINPNQISPKFSKIKLYSYDVAAKLESLKLLEAYMGNDIEETEVPFDIDRPLTIDEINKTIKYCIHDVEQTIEVFRRRINDFNASINLIETFDLPFEYINKTKGQLTAIIVDCEKQEHNDEFNIQIVPTLKLEKYAYIKDWFLDICKKQSYSEKMETNICGIPHQLGWGGLHGAPDIPIHMSGKIFHCDVTSYYPSLMIEYYFLTRNCKHPEKFKNVYDTRVALKKAGKSKEQGPYKIILNSQYGITKDKYSAAYDPVQANNICVNGQLLLIDLLEKLEKHLGEHFRLLQSNTDGIIIWIDDEEKSEKIMRHCISEWCSRTRLGMGIDGIKKIVQANVNNYVFEFDNGKLERKGAMVMELNDLSYNLPIVNEAMVEYITKGTPVEDTVNNCNEMIKFQSVFRISSSYKCAWHNGEYLTNKTYRVYASKDSKDTYLGKCRSVGGTAEKFANTPEHCFIINGSVKDIPMSIKLDRKWYIDLAKKRLNESFGYELKTGNALW